MSGKIDRNFTMVKTRSPTDNEEKVVTALRARFDDKCLDDGKYTKKYNLDKSTFCYLMKRRVTGKNLKDGNNTTGKIIEQLKADGIWSGELPWEVIKDENKRTSKSIQCN